MAAEKIAGDSAAAVAEPIELPELKASPSGKPLVFRSLDIVRDVQVKASAVLGSASISISRLSALKEGDVLELDQSIDAAVDVLIEGNLVAHGQIVVVGDRFGILITGISDQ